MNHPDRQPTMSGLEHYVEAQRLLDVAHDETERPRVVAINADGMRLMGTTWSRSPRRLKCDPASAGELRALALVHATLASTAAVFHAALLNQNAPDRVVNVTVAAPKRRGWWRRG